VWRSNNFQYNTLPYDAEILTKMEKQGRFKKRKGGKGKMEENRRKGKGKIFLCGHNIYP